jgi:hypothetical protein
MEPAPVMLARVLVMMMMLALPWAAEAKGVPRVIATLEEANAALEEAHLAYQRGDAAAALALYEQVAESGFATAGVLGNAAAAAYRAGKVGHAVLYYHRALRLDPTDQRALRSLAVISPETNAKGGGAQGFAGFVARHVTATQFALGAQLGFLLVCLAVMRAIAARDDEQRGHWVAVAGWSGAFVVAAGVMAAVAWSAAGGESNAAVVMRDGVVTRSEPNERATAQLELPAGTVVSLIGEPKGAFIQGRLADGTTSFLPIDAITRI